MGRPKLQIHKETLARLYVEAKRSPREIAEMLGCSRQTVINHLRYHNLPVRSVSEGSALAKIVYPKLDFSGSLQEKAYMIGLRTGDLTVDMANQSGKTIRVSCASTKIEQIELIQSLFSPYGRVLLNGPYKNNRVFIQCLLNESFAFLLNKCDEIPRWIRDKDHAMVGFTAGYIDAEGYIGVSARKASFRLASSDVRILRSMHRWTSELGIRAPNVRLWLQGGYTNKKTGIVSRKDIWILGIYRRESLRSFLELVSPQLKHAKRKADAEHVLTFLREQST